MEDHAGRGSGSESLIAQDTFRHTPGLHSGPVLMLLLQASAFQVVCQDIVGHREYRDFISRHLDIPYLLVFVGTFPIASDPSQEVPVGIEAQDGGL